MAKSKVEPPIEAAVEPESQSITTRFQVGAVQNMSTSGKYAERVTMTPIQGTPLDGENPNHSFALAGEINGVLQLIVSNAELDGWFESGEQFDVVITKRPKQMPSLT